MPIHHFVNAKQWRRSAAIAAATLFLLTALTACPANRRGEFAVDTAKNVVYGVGNVGSSEGDTSYEEKDLLLDVYRPVGASGMRPAVILVHGGRFMEGSKEKEEIVEYADHLASWGYVCFAINYRLRDDFPPAPDVFDNPALIAAAHAAMVDVKAAVRFVRANASTYGADPDRIGLLGESAGAVAGVTTAVTAPEAFSTDGAEFPLPPENNPGVSTRVQAYVHFWGNADHVLTEIGSDDPPVMIVHGTEDTHPGTRFEAAERFHNVVELVGISHEFFQAEDFGHGAWDYRLRGKNLKTLTREFLDEYLASLPKSAIEDRTEMETEPGMNLALVAPRWLRRLAGLIGF